MSDLTIDNFIREKKILDTKYEKLTTEALDAHEGRCLRAKADRRSDLGEFDLIGYCEDRDDATRQLLAAFDKIRVDKSREYHRLRVKYGISND